MLNEFKAFISKGNVMDLAVGIIIGVAFTAIVTSLVDDLVNPLIGMIIGGVDFSTVGFSVGDATFGVGNFINAVIKFMIIAWVVFLLVKAMNRIMPKKEPVLVETSPTELQILMEIRDQLKR